MLRARPLVLVISCVFASAGALTACTTSAPAQLSPSASAPAFVAPDPTPTDPLLTDPAPTDSTMGALAPRFPSDLVAVPKGATILLSSAVPVHDSDLVAISLNLRTHQTAADLLAAVSKRLVAAGFTRTDPSEKEPDLAAQASFARHGGDEHVILGILDAGGVRTLTLSGQVKPHVA